MAWSGAGIRSRPIGCGASVGMMESDDKKTLSRKKIISTLEENEVLVGSEVAGILTLKENDSLEVLGKKFTRDGRVAGDRHGRRFPHLRPSAHGSGLDQKGVGRQRHRNHRLLPGRFPRECWTKSIICCPTPR